MHHWKYSKSMVQHFTSTRCESNVELRYYSMEQEILLAMTLEKLSYLNDLAF